MTQRTTLSRLRLLAAACVLVAAAGALGVWAFSGPPATAPEEPRPPKYQPRKKFDSSGIAHLIPKMIWDEKAPLEEIAEVWKRIGFREIEALDRAREEGNSRRVPIDTLMIKAAMYNYEGEPKQAYAVLEEARALAESREESAKEWLYTLIFYQGVTGLRLGENDNCVLCRGESACILPIAHAAVHAKPAGSRLAIQHFTEYLRQFPDDLEVRWLLNLAHMTLGEHPAGVDPRFVLSLDHFTRSEFDIGRFRDVSDLVGLDGRLNWAGGAIMEDFDNDGLLDLVITSSDPTQNMAFYRNKGDGTFEDRTVAAGLTGQLGGLYCVQGDYNNDGHVDIFIPRSAWFPTGTRPSLLRNNGDGTFTDVTREAGLFDPISSNSAAWADYDNDGFLDLFICNERGHNRLYHNRGDGTFEEVAEKAGLRGSVQMCKGAAWIDYDNDGYPDLFLNNIGGGARLYHNNRDGTFTNVTAQMGIDGPEVGFSCWAWDYDNDGWLDIFAPSWDHTLGDVVQGLQGQPHRSKPNKLYRNEGGKRFRDVSKEVGLDLIFSTMGSNFGDFDNDGYLDFYLGTGDPNYHMLVPNRMFKNVAGKRFVEITGSSGTGHLQKGHAVACGDWDRDGNVDIFIESGGTVPGDRYHNVLFQNPGQGNNWLTVKLVGKKTNRSAIGARIKVVTAGDEPLTVHRHVTSGSSFGASPLQQHIGLAKAKRVALLEIHWPTSGTTQVFRDLDVNQAIEVTEFATDYRKLDWKPIPVPKRDDPGAKGAE